MNVPLLELLGRFPWSAGTFVALAVVFALGLWLAADRRTTALAQGAAVEVLGREWHEADLVPTHWSAETLAQAGRETGRVEEQLARWRESMAGDFPAGAGTEPPRDRSEAFFTLDSFRSRMRAAATEHGIGLRENESFGFAVYRHEGPDERLIGMVDRQRKLIEFLLTALFREPPVELRKVQRERPASGQIADFLVPAQSITPAGPADDFFAMDQRQSARVPGLIDSTAVRLVFVGRTATLRQFLAGIGGYELPLMVRSVEVERAGPLQTGVVLRADEDWDGLAQFAIIVEHLKLTRAAP